MEGLPTFAESASIPHSTGSVRQKYCSATFSVILRLFCHPTPLKFLKRDGVLYLRAKRFSTVPTPLMVLGYDTV